MKEPVTILIPVFDTPLTAVAMNSLATIQEHLGDFPITFLKGKSFTQVEELTEFCPSADFVSFDDRYFSSRKNYAKLLLSSELYYDFGWSRYLLICEMNTVITRNELAYWCRQGHDFIQPVPNLVAESAIPVAVKMRFQTQDFLRSNESRLAEFGKASGISLRNTEAFQKLIKRKGQAIHRFLAVNPESTNDAIFWEFYANRWWPEMNTPTKLSRNSFAQSATFAAKLDRNSEKPFAISGLTRPLPASDTL